MDGYQWEDEHPARYLGDHQERQVEGGGQPPQHLVGGMTAHTYASRTSPGPRPLINTLNQYGQHVIVLI